MKVDKKTIKIALKFNLKPIKSLDKDRPYISLSQDNYGRYLIIKTNHFQDEASILKILARTKQNKFVIPNVLKASKNFLIEDFIPGKKLNIFTSTGEINQEGKVILVGWQALQRTLNQEKQRLTKYTKGWSDHYSKKILENGQWLIKRIKRWFTNKHSEKKFRFEIFLEIIEKHCRRLPEQNIISFGAFSPTHIRIIDSKKLGVFDFGRHIRWAPAPYDLAYLWWGHLMDFSLVPRRKSTKYWLKAAESLSNHLAKKLRKTYWLCILERLAGLAKDLTHRETIGQKKWVAIVSKIQKKLTPIILNKLD